MLSSSPRHLDRQEISGIERKQIELPAILASHGGKASKEEALLCECLGNAPPTVHPGNGVQQTRAPVGQNAVGFLPLHPVPARSGSPDCYDQAHLASLQGTRN